MKIQVAVVVLPAGQSGKQEPVPVLALHQLRQPSWAHNITDDF